MQVSEKFFLLLIFKVLEGGASQVAAQLLIIKLHPSVQSM